MFLVWLMFILGIALPFSLKLADLPSSVANPIMVVVGCVALAIIAGSVGWRLLTGRGRGQEVRLPDPRRLSRLKWPRDLTHAELDTWVTAYLRGEGWAVAQVLSSATDGAFLEAKRAGVHLLLLCDAAKDPPQPALVRSCALAATDFPGSRPAILRQSREAYPAQTRNAARVARGLLLHVADLARLDDLAAAGAPPAAAQPAKAAEPAGAAVPR
jgi:hypothetical protein